MKTTTTCTSCGDAIPEAPLHHPDYGPALCVTCRYGGAAKCATHEDATEYTIALETAATPAPTPPDDSEHLRRLAAWFEWLDRGDVCEVGVRVKLIRHIAGKSSAKTDSGLARELGLSKGRISQLRREIKAIAPSFGNCNNRCR